MSSEQINQWMRDQLALVHGVSNYGSITVQICGFRHGTSDAVFSIYCDPYRASAQHGTIEECMETIGNKERYATLAEEKRAQAARLIAEAEEIEQTIQPNTQQ
jgi:hypothetical protein